MYDKDAYPFWKLKPMDKLEVRFLPDLNEDNKYEFIDEFHFHQVEIDGHRKMALCSLIHEDNKPCYYCVMAKKAFNNHSFGNRDDRKYWRNRHYVANVIIINDPLNITDPENPKSYTLPMGKQLFNNLREELTTSKIKEIPSDYYRGNNFVITREFAGQFPKYTGTFKRSSKLTLEQLKLAQESVLDLSMFRPTLYSSNCQDDLSKDIMWEILGND